MICLRDRFDFASMYWIRAEVIDILQQSTDFTYVYVGKRCFEVHESVTYILACIEMENEKKCK